MSVERPIHPFDLVKTHLESINQDLGKANQMRWETETHRKRTLESLEIIIDPHFILASLDGEYRTGDIITSSHATLLKEWGESARKNGLHPPSAFVSGIGFSLKIDNSTKYVRLDVLSHDWKELPKYAKTLIAAGYTVVDGQCKRVDENVDYSLFWAQRNDS